MEDVKIKLAFVIFRAGSVFTGPILHSLTINPNNYFNYLAAHLKKNITCESVLCNFC